MWVVILIIWIGILAFLEFSITKILNYLENYRQYMMNCSNVEFNIMNSNVH